jgi:hypothetical protein
MAWLLLATRLRNRAQTDPPVMEGPVIEGCFLGSSEETMRLKGSIFNNDGSFVVMISRSSCVEGAC